MTDSFYPTRKQRLPVPSNTRLYSQRARENFWLAGDEEWRSRAFASLTPAQRHILLLTMIGFTREEIAAIQGISIATVANHIQQALSRTDAVNLLSLATAFALWLAKREGNVDAVYQSIEQVVRDLYVTDEQP